MTNKTKTTLVKKALRSIGELLQISYVQSFWTSIWSFIKTVIVAGGAALLVRTIIAEPFHIPSGSMIPTFHVGDHVFVSKYPYGHSKYSVLFAPNLFSGRVFERQPHRGDVIVFRAPGKKDDYIKRLIGLPGDTIQVKRGVVYLNEKPLKQEFIGDYYLTQFEREWEKQAIAIGHQKNVVYTKGQNLFVDGKEQRKEDYTLNYVSQCNFPPEDCQALHVRKYRETLPNGVQYSVLDATPTGALDDTSKITVPKGHYFAMGDNRDMSSDSRVFGFIPEENLIGRAEFIFFSTNHYLPMLGLLFPWEWLNQIRFERLFNGV